MIIRLPQSFLRVQPHEHEHELVALLELGEWSPLPPPVAILQSQSQLAFLSSVPPVSCKQKAALSFVDLVSVLAKENNYCIVGFQSSVLTIIKSYLEPLPSFLLVLPFPFTIMSRWNPDIARLFHAPNLTLLKPFSGVSYLSLSPQPLVAHAAHSAIAKTINRAAYWPPHIQLATGYEYRAIEWYPSHMRRKGEHPELRFAMNRKPQPAARNPAELESNLSYVWSWSIQDSPI